MRRADIELRQAADDDAQFIYSLVESTMRAYVEEIWGSFSEEHNRNNVAEMLAAKSYSIIQYRDKDVGALAVERHPTHIQLAQIYILPTHQNRGIGTLLVRELLRESKQANVPLRLRVLSSNPARRLYEREGFRVTETTPERIFMERHA